MTTKLKPCPFCGRAVRVDSIVSRGIRYYQVGCRDERKCELTPITWNYPTAAEAISAWNRRAPRASRNHQRKGE